RSPPRQAGWLRPGPWCVSSYARNIIIFAETATDGRRAAAPPPLRRERGASSLRGAPRRVVPIASLIIPTRGSALRPVALVARRLALLAGRRPDRRRRPVRSDARLRAWPAWPRLRRGGPPRGGCRGAAGQRDAGANHGAFPPARPVRAHPLARLAAGPSHRHR